LIELDPHEAREHAETAIQLRESERYEYEVESLSDADLRLRCTLSTRRRSLGDFGYPDAGLIETRSFCGTTLLELVDGVVSDSQRPIAFAFLDVRSIKLNYRTQYRGMLRRISDEIAGLAADARSSAKVTFRSSFEARRDEGWLQLQLELLREMVDGPELSAALQRIVSFPHERLVQVTNSLPSHLNTRWTPPTLRQLIGGRPRRPIPTDHPLGRFGLKSVAERVDVVTRSTSQDTPENRFAKFALNDFRGFLSHAQSVFESSRDWIAAAKLAQRIADTIDAWLTRSLFREVGELQFVPLGSPVLQKKAGYREILRLWFRFRTAAEVSWEGGQDLFRVGQRNVADLYEYWLFFILLDWFCRKCKGGERPLIDELVDGLDSGSPSLRLRKRVTLGPFVGVFGGKSRHMNARFSYNQRFAVTTDRHQPGSWTRRLHPDFTFTFWPQGVSEEEAEQNELLVHLHFDAKYRVEDLEGLFGVAEEDAADEEVDGSYKRQDLLKMHAYRDAIKRSQGAYILYPGHTPNAAIFTGFHEILPGLGAFAIAPDENGAPAGFDSLEQFLDVMLDHLGNRTTAQERVSYHVSESYSRNEIPVHYGHIRLRERDATYAAFRALPPAEHMVLAIWINNDAQRLLAEADDGFAYVRLGRRRGALHVHPNLSKARHILLRTYGATVASGLLILREPGFRVFTRSQLREELTRHSKGAGLGAWKAGANIDEDEYIYALFRTRRDRDYDGVNWSQEKVMEMIESFESDIRNKLVDNVGRASPYPRVLSLRHLLKAQATTS
jgi:predicted component of viral defense system (DUF524 family)